MQYFIALPAGTILNNAARQGIMKTISSIPVYYNSNLLEKGNKASNLSHAVDNIPNIVGSQLTLKDNKISLVSTTIELKNRTIAKFIEAEELKVDNSTGSPALKVLKNAKYYVKGSSGTNQSLTINSGIQSILITFPHSATGVPFQRSPVSCVVKPTVSISSQSIGIKG